MIRVEEDQKLKKVQNLTIKADMVIKALGI